MQVQILYGKEGAKSAKGSVVIVDVFRAATCASVSLYNGVQQIYPVRTEEEALTLKHSLDFPLLMGEIGGIKIKGFDFGNSPSELQHYDFTGRSLIQRTSAGTQGLVLASDRLGKEVDCVYFGAFTTLSALANVLKNTHAMDISIVAMDGEDTEDSFYAQCLKEVLEGAIIQKSCVQEYLKNHRKSVRFFNEDVLSHPMEDFYICTDVDRYDFAVVVKSYDQYIVLKKQLP